MDDHTAPSETSPTQQAVPLTYATPHAPEHTLGNQLTRGDVACLAVKLIAVYALLAAVSSFATLLYYLNGPPSLFATGAAPVVVYGAIGTSLFIYAAKISRWLLPRTAVIATQQAGPAAAQFQAIAFSIVGLLLFASSAPLLAWQLVLLARGNDASVQVSLNARIRSDISQLVHYIVEMLLGIWLFFGSKRLATWWWSLRHTEYTPVDSEPESGANVPKE